VVSNFGSKFDSTQMQAKVLIFSQKFTHLDSWVITVGLVPHLLTSGLIPRLLVYLS
jgi:hypothetical protein